MMNYELFKEVVAEKIKDYMPQEYQDCKVEIHAVTKVNRDLDALNLMLFSTLNDASFITLNGAVMA